MRRRRWLRVGLVLPFVVLLAAPAEAEVSQLWGKDGESWTPSSRLPDFSFAGYRRGEEPFRIPAESTSIADFGARGDGRHDDTAAFRQAIEAGAGKVILIPPGRYLLSDLLEIRSSRLVLRGAGAEKSVLVFRRPLEEIRPTKAKTDSGLATTNWSWGGGLIAIGGREEEARDDCRVTAAAARGSHRLAIDPAVFQVGDEVVLTIRDDGDKSLVDYLYRGRAGDTSGLNNWKCRQVFRVLAVEGREISLDRGLRFDVRLSWQPRLQRFHPAVTDVGLEGVGFEFPADPYAGHFQELGFNPVEIGASAAHCWLRDILIRNGDSGPYVRGTFCTLDGVRLTADPQRASAQGHTGHHGITFYGHDCLCVNFSVETRFIHDLTVQSSMGCVFASGRADDLCMDHHRWAPYENLFTDIDGGEGKRLFASSGGGNRGGHTAAGSTFWKIRTRQPVSWPASLGIDAVNVIGLNVRGEELLDPAGRWLEKIPPGELEPANLYEAMRKRRQQRESGSP